MSDTTTLVIGIMIAVVLFFVTPLVVTSQRVDEIARLNVDTITSNFVDQVRVTGKLTLDNYSEFIEDLTSTGNIYDVDMEIKILDENPGKKSLQTTTTKIGENIYYSIFTTQILEKLGTNTGTNPNAESEIYLKNGDIISVTVKNNNITLGKKIKDLSFKIVGNDTYTISTTKSGLVVTTGEATLEMY